MIISFHFLISHHFLSTLDPIMTYQVLDQAFQLLLGLVYRLFFPDDDDGFFVSVISRGENHPGTRFFTNLQSNLVSTFFGKTLKEL